MPINPALAEIPPYQLVHPDTITNGRVIAANERLLLLGSQTIQPGTSVTVTSGGELSILPPAPVPTPAPAPIDLSGCVPTTRRLTTTFPLTGGDTLANDLTLGITPEGYDIGTRSLATDQFRLHYQHLKLSGTERLTMAGTAEVLLTDFGAYASTVLGKPKAPNVPFTVPNDYYLDIFTRLDLRKNMRATLQGTADLILTDDFNTRSRITLAGRG